MTLSKNESDAVAPLIAQVESLRGDGVKPHFRVLLCRHESNPDWQIVSNPRWDYFTKAQSAILENFANDYAEYKNCGCLHRMVKVEDLNKYGLKLTNESYALDPRHKP